MSDKCNVFFVKKGKSTLVAEMNEERKMKKVPPPGLEPGHMASEANALIH
jgi:hypothetical protein